MWAMDILTIGVDINSHISYLYMNFVKQKTTAVWRCFLFFDYFHAVDVFTGDRIQ